MKKRVTLLVCAAFLLCFAFAGAAFADNITVYYTIMSMEDTYDDKDLMYEKEVSLPEGSTIFRGLKRACWGQDEQFQTGEVPMSYSGSGAGLYVYSIYGVDAAQYTFWDGWMYRVNDVMYDYSCDDPTNAVLNDGDKVTWYYAEPERTRYTKIDEIWKDGSTVKVRVQEDHFLDAWNWIRQGFDNLAGAVVNLEYNGTPLTPVTTDANGVAQFTYQGGGTYKAWVEPKWEQSGSYEGLPEHVISWSQSKSL
jgi:outer membrane protein assembly factor BamE (lipoprotein component of BamABCDE complex)